jgi:hypothetical protein
MIVPFLAVILTGLAVIAPAAHLLEMPRKMRLPKDRYFIVQDIYRGWVLVGFFLPLRPSPMSRSQSSPAADLPSPQPC